ncbi:exo-beta-N-acetylmuramidase NamZ domain-containing protein, partial [Streptomyces sp. GSL17-113]
RPVVPGADVAAAAGWRMLRGRKVGVVSNPTGVLRDASHVVDSMAARDELRIMGVFGPEHGFRGSAQAGESEPEFKDPRTGLT